MTNISMSRIPADELAASEAVLGSPDAKINPIHRTLPRTFLTHEGRRKMTRKIGKRQASFPFLSLAKELVFYCTGRKKPLEGSKLSVKEDQENQISLCGACSPKIKEENITMPISAFYLFLNLITLKCYLGMPGWLSS